MILYNETGTHCSVCAGVNGDVFVCALAAELPFNTAKEITVTQLTSSTMSNSTISFSLPLPVQGSNVHFYPLHSNHYALWCEGTPSLLIIDSNESTPRIADLTLTAPFSRLFVYSGSEGQGTKS